MGALLWTGELSSRGQCFYQDGGTDAGSQPAAGTLRNISICEFPSVCDLKNQQRSTDICQESNILQHSERLL